MIKLSAPGGESGVGEAFQWSTTEQVYPLEKFTDGSTLYAKEVECGVPPATGEAFIAHNILGMSGDKVHRMEGRFYTVSAGTSLKFLNVPQVWNATNSIIFLGLRNDTDILIGSNSNSHWNTQNYQLLVRLIYKK